MPSGDLTCPVVEAYINDHKQQRSLLLARSTLELSNQLLHEYSSEATVDYKNLNVDLDKYTRAFDVIRCALSVTAYQSECLLYLPISERAHTGLQAPAGGL